MSLCWQKKSFEHSLRDDLLPFQTGLTAIPFDQIGGQENLSQNWLKLVSDRICTKPWTSGITIRPLRGRIKNSQNFPVLLFSDPSESQ
jgi:hypothetical protein